MSEFININDVDYGAYVVSDEPYFSEAMQFGRAVFNRLYTQKIRLPEGKGNVVYLLSNTFDNTLKFVDGNTFMIPPTYRKLYYPIYKLGAFFGRRYKIILTKEKKTRDALIKKNTNLNAYPTRDIAKNLKESIFIDTSDLYQQIVPILNRFPIQKVYKEFFTDFFSIVTSWAPDKIKSTRAIDNNRIIMIDANGFSFNPSAKLAENKTNPLFLFYLVFLRTGDLSITNIDMDIVVVSENTFIKFNPSVITKKDLSRFKTAIFKMAKANFDDYIDALPDDDKEDITVDTKQTIANIAVDKKVNSYTTYNSPAIKSMLNGMVKDEIKTKAAVTRDIRKDIAKVNIDVKPDKRVVVSSPTSIPRIKPVPDFKKYNKIVAEFDPLFANTDEVVDDESDEDEIFDTVSSEAEYVLDNDANIAAEVESEIQQKIAPLDSKRNSPINSARDEKLREQQKKVIVDNETIEEILSREDSNVPIQSDDKSAVIHTTNQNMKAPTFVNFDKTYIDELYVKHVVASFDCLKDKNNPFYIISVERYDSSTALDLKETWVVKLRDETNKMHTIKVDMPKFYQDRFLWIGGNRKMILKQNLYNPVVKDTPNVVIVTTNYNKVTIGRRSSASFSTVNKLLSFIKKTKTDDMFVFGDSSSVNIGNSKYINTLEYDEISKTIFEFKSGTCQLYFNRDFISENFTGDYGRHGNEFLIGFDDGAPILINEDTGKDRNGRTIVQIMYESFSEDDKHIFDSIKEGKNMIFAEGKLLGKFIPVIIILTIWNGIRKSLDSLDIQWEFHAGKRAGKSDFNKGIIKFQDGYLEFEKNLYSELILNGLYKLKPETISFESLDDTTGYVEYIHSVFGTYSILTQFKTFNEFFIDPITKEVCRNLQYPSDSSGLLTYATKLLADNSYVNKASDKSYRLRSVEIIPAILYDELAIAYKRYVDSGGRIPFSIAPGSVIKKLIDVNTVEDYSTLNPAVEVGKMYTVSAKGFKGSNEDRSYDEEKRSYDESSIGKLAMSTSNDANVGINRELVIEPTITGALGFREPVDDIDQLTDVNIFSPVEMLTPGSVRIDDPVRTAMANKQTKHLVPVEDSSPSLVSNGFDEMIQFYLSNDFVVNAKEDGEVVEISESTGFVMVRYKSGEVQAISLNPEIVKNSNGGFYLTQVLECPFKLGQKFKKNEVLAYHPKYFSLSKMNGLRFNMGPNVKVAFLSTYNTYEDAGVCTNKLSEQLRTAITYKEIGTFNKNNNILKIAQIGDNINIGDVLVKYDESFDDKDINAFISKLSEDSKDDFEESIKSDVTAHHAGIIRDIKVYSQYDPDALSESLGDIVREYFNRGISKKDFLSKYDNTTSIVKAGYLLTDTTEPLVSRYNEIKKIKNVDVLIEFYIESESSVKTGDKIAIYSANKNIVSEMIPEGYEPTSEFRPDEEISILNNPGTIARRMTSSVMPIAAANKIMIELKRSIISIVKYSGKNIMNRKAIEDIIYNTYTAIDPSGVNTDKYHALFDPMNDSQFSSFMKQFLSDSKENFMLDIVELEHDLDMDKCEAAAKVLKIPLFEYVYLPHLSMDKNNIPVTKQKCLVGYLNIKRTQQTIEKKNGLATSNTNRSAITNQAVNDDKNARDSDTEASLLASLGAYDILRELHGPRADDMVMKNEMDQQIANKGYVELNELTNSTTNKSTLNVVNTYMIGMQLKTDLVTPTYLTNNLINKVK